MRFLPLPLFLIAAAGLARAQQNATACRAACGEWAATQHRRQAAACGSTAVDDPECFCQTTAMLYGVQECMLANCPDLATNLLQQCKDIHAALRVGSAGFSTSPREWLFAGVVFAAGAALSL